MIIAALPAYNEEKHIAEVILGAAKHVDRVVVVDDGSTDRTSAIAHACGAVVVRHARNRGYGAAIRACFETAKRMHADTLVTLDSDGQHDPEDIGQLIHALGEGSDIVIGSRFMGANGRCVPLYRRIGIHVLTVATNVVGGMDVSDSQSGFRAYSRKAMSRIEITASDMSAGSGILFQAKKHKLEISEVPITCRYDVGSISSQNPVYHGTIVLASILWKAAQDHSTCSGIAGITGITASLLGAGMLAGNWIADIHMPLMLLMLSVIGLCTGVALQPIVDTCHESEKDDL
ncbi:MAG: glycosyltransferase family 2 protein [Euryarchaeota archaeon]|nr:glycosyltransferase family 2 protein [Euryarchaeota archaeon]